MKNKDKAMVELEKACQWWESRCDALGVSKYQIELFRKAMEGK